MNGTSATYGFLPWFKRGLSAAIERVDGSAGCAPRAAVPIRLTFNAGAQAQQVTAHLALYGPGEIAGIDSRVIIRTDPRPDVTDAESNYFPLIEFDQPDFPWRFTPAVANAQDRLRPWIVLIVLADEELAASKHADVVHGRLPTISLPDARALPNLAQSWAWAHVQLSGVTREQLDDAAEIARIDRDEPHRILSRLLCARHLKARTPYTAYLVPAFERGRLPGLNEELPDDLDALAPASQSGSLEPVVLPVYYQWRFQTADDGDFESLVRELLPPRVLPDTVGRREMDASDPGSKLDATIPREKALLTGSFSDYSDAAIHHETAGRTDIDLQFQGNDVAGQLLHTAQRFVPVEIFIKNNNQLQFLVRRSSASFGLVSTPAPFLIPDEGASRLFSFLAWAGKLNRINRCDAPGLHWKT